ncbi:unnamed protein product [Effrenium voratum]|nr:unnamed protein product [Effrenium voratum]
MAELLRFSDGCGTRTGWDSTRAAPEKAAEASLQPLAAFALVTALTACAGRRIRVSCSARATRTAAAGIAPTADVSDVASLQDAQRQKPEVPAELREKYGLHLRLMEKGFSRLGEVEESGLLDQGIRLTIRILQKTLDSADVKFRQLDMEKPKVAGILCTPGILEIFGGTGWVEEREWLVLPEGTPLELSQLAIEGLEKEERRRATVQSTAENPNERRFNPWDGKVYTFQELERCLARADLTTGEIQEHWAHRCRPVAKKATQGTAEVPVTEPQVEAWQKIWRIQSLNRMWTAADTAHVHAVSGGIYMFLGAAFLLDTAVHDAMALNGSAWERVLPSEVGLLALMAGVANALSGLQPSLMKRFDLQMLGLGPQGDIKSGGFLNAAAFYLVLAFQSARGLAPELGFLDVPVGLVTLLLVAHQAFILNSWVSSGKMHRVDAFLVPGIFNLPVALHFLSGSQAWWQEMTAHFSAWPEFFFAGNFAIAWACSMVTLVLSMYERRVISLELRSLLMLTFPAIVFLTVLLRAEVLLPNAESSLWLLLTLNPLSHLSRTVPGSPGSLTVVDELAVAAGTSRSQLVGKAEMLVLGLRSAGTRCRQASLKIQKGDLLSRADDTAALCVAQQAVELLKGEPGSVKVLDPMCGVGDELRKRPVIGIECLTQTGSGICMRGPETDPLVWILCLGR